MPVYEYECGSCGSRFEVTRKFSDPELTTCVRCNAGNIRKVLSPAAFVLKGGGWYATDYPSADRKQAVGTEKNCGDQKSSQACSSGACAGACPSKG